MRAGSTPLAVWSFLFLLLSSVACATPHAAARLANPRAWKAKQARSYQSKRSYEARAVEPAPGNQSCFAPGAHPIQAPHANIWAALSIEETASVAAWLFSQSQFNLTTTELAGPWDNVVTMIELMPPNKTDSVAYIDRNGTAPPRYAHVIISHLATEEPTFQDLLVGPLPIKNATVQSRPLTYPYTRKTEGKIRNLDADGLTWYNWTVNVSSSIADITLDLWNGTFLGLENDTLLITGIDPVFQDDGIVRWDQFWNLPTAVLGADTLLPLGLYYMTNVTGRDPSKWTVDGWLYNDIFYPSTEEFRAAYFASGFVKNPPIVDGSWASSAQDGDVPALDNNFPPIAIAPSGARYFVDPKQQYVKWMDFEFYTSFSRDTGLTLYNIKYKGERIIYELGLQEALAHYAGNDPIQSGTSYLDSFYGFGTYSYQLIKGYDCPSYATYMNSSYYDDEYTTTHMDSICLFETTANYPLSRHSTIAYDSATKNVFFTIRTSAAIANYDYIISYEFYMDGSINIVVRTSGYIQGAYVAKNEDYGYQIHDSLSGSMYDRVLNFKIDFDILGTANTMSTTTHVATSETYPWSKGKQRNTMKLERGAVETENESKLNWAPNGATAFSVVNQDAKNTYGEYRGYDIRPSSQTIHLTVQNSSNLERSANWATHDLYVTRQHDTEPRSSHRFQSQDVLHPPVDFDAFFDGESLVQQDLVVWANLGMHHVPHTGDLPYTVSTTAVSSLMLSPVNYLAGSPSRQTVNMVNLFYGDEAGTVVETYGQGSAECGVSSVQSLLPDLRQPAGDESAKIFPYDPNNPSLGGNTTSAPTR